MSKLKGGILIVSVPHTGTVFTKGLLCNARLSMGHERAGVKAYLNPMQHHCHSDSIFPLLEARPQMTLVVPLRHPEKCWRTWCRRGTGLQSRREKAKFDQFVQAWKWLDEICRDRPPLYLPVDHEDRDFYLKKMEMELGLEMSHDWTPRNVTEGSLIMHDVQEKDLSEVMALDVVRRFYE